MTSRDTLLAALEPAEQELLRYTDATGSFVSKKLKRLYQLKHKFIFAFVARKLRLAIDVRATLFWGRKVLLPLVDVDVATYYYFGLLGHKELPLIKYCIKNLQNNDVVYDIGASHGLYTYLALEILNQNDGGQCHTFEPNSRTFSYLQKNTVDSIEDNTLILNQVALSETDGETEFFTELQNGASGVGTTKKEVVDTWSAAHTKVTVQTISLDSYTHTHRVPTFIKLDVEGAELEVLKGGEQFFKTHSPTIAMEVWSGEKGRGHSLPAVNQLRVYGYAPYAISADGELSECEFDELLNFSETFTNYIFKK